MKRIKTTILASALALSAVLPVANTYAAGTTYIYTSYVNGSSIYVEGEASAGTLAVSIEVYDETGATKLAGPETVNTDSNFDFTYNLSGDFDATKTYKVCTADYDGGEKTCEKTVKLIKTVDITVKNPKIGDTVTLVDQGGYSVPDKEPVASVSSTTYELSGDQWWGDGLCSTTSYDCYDYFEGTFEKDKSYVASIDLQVSDPDKYRFADDVTVKINGKVVSYYSVWPGGYGLLASTAIKATVDGKSETVDATNPDTGVAPKRSETADKAVANISLGTAAAVASAILYGAHLIIKRKKEA